MHDSIQLVREACRQTLQLEPYNAECIRKMIDETRMIYKEASGWILRTSATQSLFSEGDDVRLLAVRLLSERNKRILLGYHETRLALISFITSTAIGLPQKAIRHSTPSEIKFANEYRFALDRYFSPYQDFIDFQFSKVPPKDLYIQIRSLQNCGLIQTENGLLNLSANSLHFVRRADVQNLLDQGLVVHIK